MGFIRETQLGSTRLFFLCDGTFRLDGGGMFRVVPQSIWSELCQPDEKGRIEIALGSLAWETENGVYLFDTGLGRAIQKNIFYTAFGVQTQEGLPSLLKKARLDPNNIQAICLTHLHFDHAGGLVGDGGEWLFPETEIIFSQAELTGALNPTELNRASYRPEILEPLQKHKKLRILDSVPSLPGAGLEIFPGLHARFTPGHSTGHLIYELESEGQIATVYSDLIPMRQHTRLPYITAFDIEPLVTLENKRAEINRAIEKETLAVFIHDPNTPFGIIKKGPRYAFADTSPFDTEKTGN